MYKEMAMTRFIPNGTIFQGSGSWADTAPPGSHPSDRSAGFIPSLAASSSNIAAAAARLDKALWPMFSPRRPAVIGRAAAAAAPAAAPVPGPTKSAFSGRHSADRCIIAARPSLGEGSEGRAEAAPHGCSGREGESGGCGWAAEPAPRWSALQHRPAADISAFRRADRRGRELTITVGISSVIGPGSPQPGTAVLLLSPARSDWQSDGGPAAKGRTV